MIVDDAEDVRMLIQALVETQPDWEIVATAGDGREAVDVATVHQPELILLDASMPVMDGLAALPLLNACVPGARVVMLSAFPRTTMESSALDAGADGYIEKAQLVATLVPQVQQILDSPRIPLQNRGAELPSTI